MPKEFDLFGIGSIRSWVRLRKKAATIPPGVPCMNCQTILQGAYCHACGQFAADYHRSIFGLVAEFIEGFFHHNSRLWRTLPGLLIAPGRLTKAYLDGKRASQILPFRLFLLALLLLLTVGHFVYESSASRDPLGFLKNIHADTTDTVVADADDTDATREIKREVNQALKKQGIKMDPNMSRAQSWIKERVDNIRRDPERFLLILEIWGYRVAVLALPLMALLLTMLFIFQRRFYVYDHVVFSIHSITFHFLALAAVLALTLVVGGAAWWLALVSPFHVWFHMRKVYSTSVFGTLFRMVAMGFGTLLGFAMLAVLWIFLGVSAMSGHPL
jgi:hypothetical protein